MRKNLTELVFILDKSGSMLRQTRNTISGFNSMIAEQKQQEGQALVTTILFSDSWVMLHDRKDLKDIPKMTELDYVAKGMTALYDAVGSAIEHIKKIHKYAREEDLPEKTMFVITTDGKENASKKYSRQDVHDMIEERKSAGWEFVFAAANIDAVRTGASIGIQEASCLQYDVGDEVEMYNDISMMVEDFRGEDIISENRRPHLSRRDINKSDANKSDANK